MNTGRSFRSLFMAATCAGAALSCYLVSLRVASERSALEDVEGQIVMAQRDVRVLQTELGTRGRLAQLERWNASALALSAPTAEQFLSGSFELARLTRPETIQRIDAPVVLASAPAPAPSPAPLEAGVTDDSGAVRGPSGSAMASLTPGNLMRQASLKAATKFGTREVSANPAAKPSAAAGKSKDQPVTAAKPVDKRSLAKPSLAAAKPAASQGPKAPKKSVDKPALAQIKAVTKPRQIAKADPLAPLPGRRGGVTHKEPAPPQ